MDNYGLKDRKVFETYYSSFVHHYQQMRMLPDDTVKWLISICAKDDQSKRELIDFWAAVLQEAADMVKSLEKELCQENPVPDRQ